jgi:GxxExxY protein
MELADLSDRVIGRDRGSSVSGAWLARAAYSQWAQELTLRHIAFKRQVELPVFYKGVRLDCGYRLDMLVDACLIVELKAVDRLQSIHRAQLLTYMKMTRVRVGLLINFNCRVLRDGLVRLVL